MVVKISYRAESLGGPGGTEHDWGQAQEVSKAQLAPGEKGSRAANAARWGQTELCCFLAAWAGILSPDAKAVAVTFGRPVEGPALCPAGRCSTCLLLRTTAHGTSCICCLRGSSSWCWATVCTLMARNGRSWHIPGPKGRRYCRCLRFWQTLLCAYWKFSGRILWLSRSPSCMRIRISSWRSRSRESSTVLRK